MCVYISVLMLQFEIHAIWYWCITSRSSKTWPFLAWKIGTLIFPQEKGQKCKIFENVNWTLLFILGFKKSGCSKNLKLPKACLLLPHNSIMSQHLKDHLIKCFACIWKKCSCMVSWRCKYTLIDQNRHCALSTTWLPPDEILMKYSSHQ